MPDIERAAKRANADLSRRRSRADSRAKADRRFAWWLVWLYPPAFRRDVALGLVDALDDRMRERRAAGATTAGVRTPAIADTLRNAPVEWARVEGRSGRRAVDGIERRRSSFVVLRSSFGTQNAERRTQNIT